MASPAHRSDTTQFVFGGNPTSVTGTEPAGAASGDGLLLIGLIDHTGTGSGAVNTPTGGWTLRNPGGTAILAGDFDIWVWTLRRSGSAPSYQISWANGLDGFGYAEAHVCAASGVVATGEFVDDFQVAAAGTGTSVNPPAVTLGTIETLVYAVGGSWAGWGSAPTLASYTIQIGGGAFDLALGSRQIAGTVTEDPAAFSAADGSADFVAFTIAFRSVGASATLYARNERIFVPGKYQQRIPPFWPPSVVPLSTQNAVVANAYTLVADPGSLTLAGTAATLRIGYSVVATPGALTLSGTATTLANHHRITADSGTLTLAGTSAELVYGHKAVAARPVAVPGGFQRLIPPFWPPSQVPLSTQSARQTLALACDAGSLTLSGTATTLRHAHVIACAAGSLALSGTATGLSKGYRIACDSGTLAITGAATALRHAHALACAPGTLALSGTAAGLTKGTRVTCEAGALVLSGATTALVHGRPMVAAAGSLTLSGTACALTIGRPIVCTPGSLALAGTVAALTKQYRLVCSSGTLALAGTNTALTYSGSGNRTLAAETVALALAGTQTALSAQRRIAADAAALSLSGTATGLRAGRNLPAAPGALALAANDAGIRKASRLAADTTALALNGTVVQLRKGISLAAAAGALLIAGQAVNFSRSYRLQAQPGTLTLSGTAAGLQYGTAYHRAPTERVAVFGAVSRIAKFS